MQTLTPLLVQQNAIDKLNPNVQVILLPSNSNFLLPSNLFGPGAGTGTGGTTPAAPQAGAALRGRGNVGSAWYS